jgi:hypothetical protein
MNPLTTLTLFSTAVAAAMTLVVLRLVLLERRRSAARVSALEADIYRTEEEDILVLHDPPSLVRSGVQMLPDPAPRRTLPVVSFVAAGAAIVFGVAVGASRYRSVADEPARPATALVAAQALELLSLDHERADDHLTVRGVIRNPPRGSEVDHLTAVVLLFNQQGGFLTSGRSPIESAALQPGTEAQFVVTVPGAADVGKYRVSFRTDDRIVPHVDRRW